MLALLQRYSLLLSLLPALLLGLALGDLAATGAGVWLAPGFQASELPPAGHGTSRRQQPLTSYAPILQRNIFDSSGPASAPEPDAAEAQPSQAAPARPRVVLHLVGTVTAGANSLAVLGAGREIKRYRLGDEVPGGGTVQEITRTTVRIEYPGGRSETLSLLNDKGAAAAKGPTPAARAVIEGRTNGQPPTAAGSLAANVKAAGDNRWIIDRAAVATARNNMNQLLQQARMEPYIVDGQTRGFQVKWIQRNSLLSLLGLRPGDVVVEVNNVQLDSPEKALMIFQQLREARTLSVGLVRGGKREVFQYEFQ